MDDLGLPPFMENPIPLNNTPRVGHPVCACGKAWNLLAFAGQLGLCISCQRCEHWGFILLKPGSREQSQGCKGSIW